MRDNTALALSDKIDWDDLKKAIDRISIGDIKAWSYDSKIVTVMVYKVGSTIKVNIKEV